MLNIKQIFILPLINPKKTNISIIKKLYILFSEKLCKDKEIITCVKKAKRIITKHKSQYYKKVYYCTMKFC